MQLTRFCNLQLSTKIVCILLYTMNTTNITSLYVVDIASFIAVSALKLLIRGCVLALTCTTELILGWDCLPRATDAAMTVSQSDSCISEHRQICLLVNMSLNPCQTAHPLTRSLSGCCCLVTQLLQLPIFTGNGKQCDAGKPTNQCSVYRNFPSVSFVSNMTFFVSNIFYSLEINT